MEWKEWRLLEKKRSGIWNLLALGCLEVFPTNQPTDPTKTRCPSNKRDDYGIIWPTFFLDWVTLPTKYGGRAKKKPKNIWGWQMRILQCTFSRSRFHFPNNQMTESIHISFTTLRPWSEVAVWARCAPTGRVALDGSRWMAAFVPQIKLG